MNTAIIVAAGSGSRFASDIPKQFIELAGKPVIIHTLEKFEACPDVDEIILVLSEDGRERFESLLGERSFSKLHKLVAGGAARAESVKNGVDQLDDSCGIVAVHDGARPLVTTDEISATIREARESGAACLVAEVLDTIKDVQDGYIHATLDRSTLRRALTPQAFRVEVLRRAFGAAGPSVMANATDECYLVENLGYKIAYVEGSARNIKITRADDMIVAAALIDAEAV